MKILFIEMASDDTVGGSHTCLFNLIKHINSKNYKCYVVFNQYNIYCDKLKHLGIPVYLVDRIPYTSQNVIMRKIINWYRLVYQYKEKLSSIFEQLSVDLTVINNSIVNCHEVVSVANKYNTPIISYERGYFNYRKNDIRLTRHLHAAIAVSNAIKINMLNQNYYAKAHVIYDGLPTKKGVEAVSFNDKLNIKHKLNIPPDSIVIGIIGNIREWKGQEYFVRAFMSLGEKYPNLYGLVIGGYGPEDLNYYNFIKSISEKSEVGRRIKFLGYRDDVPELLEIMDIFVHASIKPEPFGMVILEAMQQQVPVIATNFGGPVETLENGHCGILVPPRDINAIIEAIEKYINNSTFRSEMVTRAYKRVTEDFDINKTVGFVKGLFEEALTDGDGKLSL